MVSTDFLIPALFFATFAVAIVWGVRQYMKVNKAKREKTQSAAAKVNGEPVSGGSRPVR